MITKNFEDYPEHRLKFFSLLRAIGTHCFQALIQLSDQVMVIYYKKNQWQFKCSQHSCHTFLILFLSSPANETCDGFYHVGFQTY